MQLNYLTKPLNQNRMEPKEKAKELVDKFVLKSVFDMNNDELIESRQLAKQYALIAVDEIRYFMINTLKWDKKHNGNVLYWEEVKQELNNL